MDNKRIALLFLIALLAISAVSATQTILSKENELKIDLLKYDPSPMQPGSPSDIWFEITNLGAIDIDNFELTLVDGIPSLLKGDDAKKLNFGTLKAGNKITFRFTITPNADMPDGDYTVSLQYYSRRLTSITSTPITLKVKRTNRIVGVSESKVTQTASSIDDQILAPGEPAQFTVSISNPADYTMRDITVKLDLSSDSIPIAPLGTTAEKKINAIAARQSSDIVFDLVALPGAASNIYKVPLKIAYYDEVGNNYTRNDLIGLIVSGKPELHIEVKDNKLYSRWGVGDITLNFVNKGLTKIRFLTVRLDQQKNNQMMLGKRIPTENAYSLLSEKEVYLGDVDPDDDQSADFKLKVRTLSKKLEMPVTVTFRDANNREYTQQFTVQAGIYSKKELGLESDGTWWKIFMTIIVLALFIGYLRWKKANKTQGPLNYLKFLLSKISFRKHDR